MGFEPAQHFEPIHFGQLEVQQDDGGQLIAGPAIINEV
jgi:hypothetical protein